MDIPARPEDARVAALLDQLDPRAAPLVITVFGDAIAPRGGNISLASLIQLMAPFGVSERLVRTVVYRLSRDGWFATSTRGRRSFYALSDQAQKTFGDADRRIYASSGPVWDGCWTLVQASPDMPAKARQKLREELKWRGFGQLSPTLLVSPRNMSPDLARDIAKLHQTARPAVFRARLVDAPGLADPRATASTAWEIDRLNAAYGQLLTRFSPFACAAPATALDFFVLRTLAIHEYRRTLLKDPQLPSELTPSGWHGDEARAVVTTVYNATAPAADGHFEAIAECWDGACPAPNEEYRRRFR